MTAVPPPPDANLLRLAQAGDEAAFTSLAETWHATIHRWAMGLVDDADDADDVAQTVLVRFATRLRSFRGASRLSTWLYQVTRNAAMDVLRTRRRRGRLLDRLRRSDPMTAAPPDPAATLERADLAGRARAALAALPLRQREVLDLVDLQAHAPHEAAALLGISPATARVHLLRARRALRAALLASDPQPGAAR